MNKVRLDQKIGTVATNPGERAVARLLSATLQRDPDGQSEQDLLADAYHAYYKADPSLKASVTPERDVNRALVEWMMEARNFQDSKANTTGNIPASLSTSSLAWHLLTTDDAVQDALNKQKEAEKATEAAQRNIQEATQEQDPERRQAKMDMAERAMQDAQALAQEAVEKIEGMKQSPHGQAVMNVATEDAKEKGEKVAAMMRSWGIEPGNMTTSDVESVLYNASDTPLGDKLKEIARLAGRMKGIAMNSIKDARRALIGPAVKPARTTQIEHLFHDEFILMSRKAQDAIRAVKIAQFVDNGGLLGWTSTASKKESGDIEIYIDGSGSMSGAPEIVAKAISLGLVRAIMDEPGNVRRWYRLSQFSTKRDGFIQCDSDSSWREHLEWASKMFNGGTDFNYVFESAIDMIRSRHRKGKRGTDMILITDGISGISSSVIDRWKTLVNETGARLITIAINIPQSYIDQLEAISSLMINVDSYSRLEVIADKICARIAETVARNEINR